MCFSSARMASLGLRPYLERVASSLHTISCKYMVRRMQAFGSEVGGLLLHTLYPGCLEKGEISFISRVAIGRSLPRRGFSRQRSAYSPDGAISAFGSRWLHGFR